MVDPAQTPDEFERKARHTPNIARFEELTETPDDMVVQDAIYYKAYLSSDMAQRMETATDSFEAIESIHRRLRTLGADEIKIDEHTLIIAYKPPTQNN